jgi:hypothetical protein
MLGVALAGLLLGGRAALAAGCYGLESEALRTSINWVAPVRIFTEVDWLHQEDVTLSKWLEYVGKDAQIISSNYFPPVCDADDSYRVELASPDLQLTLHVPVWNNGDKNLPELKEGVAPESRRFTIPFLSESNANASASKISFDMPHYKGKILVRGHIITQDFTLAQFKRMFPLSALEKNRAFISKLLSGYESAPDPSSYLVAMAAPWDVNSDDIADNCLISLLEFRFAKGKLISLDLRNLVECCPCD